MINNVKMVDIGGRLKSPLPDSEIVLKMIRELRIFYSTKMRELQHTTKNDFTNVLNHFMAELKEIEDVAEKSKVLIVRLVGSVNNVEKTLNSYRRKLKKTKKQNPGYKQHMQIVESYLNKVRKIKKGVREEAERSIREEKWIHDEAA